ncbi:MAG TPA: hypothetical protein VID48_07450 [Solirubrobacteraceae bacterium]|jgi:hypothetical protein
MRELRARNIIRTNNNPARDIAEAIVTEYYSGERGGFAQAGRTGNKPLVPSQRPVNRAGRRSMK